MELRVFKEGTALATMRNLNTTEGHILEDIVTEEGGRPIIEEELYSSLNALSFSYPYDGVNYGEIKHNAYIRVSRSLPSGEVYTNLYRVSYVRYQPEMGLINIEADHYTVAYMSESVSVSYNHEGTTTLPELFTNIRRMSKHISVDLGIHYMESSYRDLEIDVPLLKEQMGLDATWGTLLVGPSSFLRKHLDGVVHRTIDGLLIDIRPDLLDRAKNEHYMLSEGINIEEFGYERESQDIYTQIIPDVTSMPSYNIHGDGRFGVFSGIGGSKYETMAQLPVGLVFYGLYKGFPLTVIRKSDGTYETSSNAFIQNEGGIKPFSGRAQRSSDVTIKTTGGVTTIEIFMTDGNAEPGKGRTDLLDEVLDPNYLYFYGVYTTYPFNWGVSRNEISLGIPEHIYVESEGNKNTYAYVELDKTKYLYTIQIPGREGNLGKNALKIPYEKTDGDDFDFYKWLYVDFKKEVTGRLVNDTKKELFTLEILVDELQSLYGEVVDTGFMLRIGQVLPYSIRSYGLAGNGEVVRTVYDLIDSRTVIIEFSNKQDDLDEIYTTKKQKDYIKRITQSINSNKSPNKQTTKPGGGSTGGGDDDEEIDLDEQLQDLIDKLLPDEEKEDFELLTDDFGPRVAFQTTVQTAQVDTSADVVRSSGTKVLYYNGAETVVQGNLELYEMEGTVYAGSIFENTPTRLRRYWRYYNVDESSSDYDGFVGLVGSSRYGRPVSNKGSEQYTESVQNTAISVSTPSVSYNLPNAIVTYNGGTNFGDGNNLMSHHTVPQQYRTGGTQHSLYDEVIEGAWGKAYYYHRFKAGRWEFNQKLYRCHYFFSTLIVDRGNTPELTYPGVTAQIRKLTVSDQESFLNLLKSKNISELEAIRDDESRRTGKGYVYYLALEKILGSMQVNLNRRVSMNVVDGTAPSEIFVRLLTIQNNFAYSGEITYELQYKVDPTNPGTTTLVNYVVDKETSEIKEIDTLNFSGSWGHYYEQELNHIQLGAKSLVLSDQNGKRPVMPDGTPIVVESPIVLTDPNLSNLIQGRPINNAEVELIYVTLTAEEKEAYLMQYGTMADKALHKFNKLFIKGWEWEGAREGDLNYSKDISNKRMYLTSLNKANLATYYELYPESAPSQIIIS